MAHSHAGVDATTAASGAIKTKLEAEGAKITLK